MTSPEDGSCRVLGIDPGSRVTGYGVIHCRAGQTEFIACGTIRSTDSVFSRRLLEIHEGLCEVIAAHRPNEAAVEDVFVAGNPRTALKLGQARGVAVLAALRHGLPVHDYPPRQIKLAVAGYGQAAKTQVQHMVRVLLGLAAAPSADAADALAVALCHAHRLRMPVPPAPLPRRSGAGYGIRQ